MKEVCERSASVGDGFLSSGPRTVLIYDRRGIGFTWEPQVTSSSASPAHSTLDADPTWNKATRRRESGSSCVNAKPQSSSFHPVSSPISAFARLALFCLATRSLASPPPDDSVLAQIFALRCCGPLGIYMPHGREAYFLPVHNQQPAAAAGTEGGGAGEAPDR
jgi:hypothetical protein